MLEASQGLTVVHQYKEEGQRGEPLVACCSSRLWKCGSSCLWRYMDTAEARRCFSLLLSWCGCHGWRRLHVPCRLAIWASRGLPSIHLCILPQCSWGSPLEASSSLAPLQLVGMLSVEAGVILVEQVKKERRRATCHCVD